MALANLLNTRPETPYKILPPLHVCIVKLQDRPKVLSWTFTETTATPGVVKSNKVAAMSDGHSVTAVTLFEEFAGRVKEGSSYMLKGHELRGQGPPYQINITRRTQFFRASNLKVDEHVKDRATALLEPPSPLTSLSASLGTTTLMTVEGEVVEVSAVKSVGSIRQKIPLKNIRIKQDQHIIPLSLWREAAVVDMAVGDTVSISHVRASTTTYGAQLQSTALTTIKAKEEVQTSTFIVGVMEGEEEESVRVLFEDGETALISNQMWAPFDEQLKSEKVNVQIRLEGKKITEIREL